MGHTTPKNSPIIIKPYLLLVIPTFIWCLLVTNPRFCSSQCWSGQMYSRCSISLIGFERTMDKMTNPYSSPKNIYTTKCNNVISIIILYRLPNIAQGIIQTSESSISHINGVWPLLFTPISGHLWRVCLPEWMNCQHLSIKLLGQRPQREWDPVEQRLHMDLKRESPQSTGPTGWTESLTLLYPPG